LKREIKITADGSSTIYLPELEENYHSIYGAVQESMHVFIESGLFQFSARKTIRIFEMGFGTGLNCLLSLLYSKQKEVFYYALEKYPLDKEIWSQLNYAEILEKDDRLLNIFSAIHAREWDKRPVEMSPGFFLAKELGDISSFQSGQQFDLIYFDAFAPQVQPELWTAEIFQKMHDILLPEGILVTYCAKGSVRRNLIQAGFQAERLPGPPGKREMLRAIRKL
jgi:tRNA U34 5-methylaminomethyl-2-thiouridine-forming methyltransferase MnmC